jgi:cell division protein FtsB
MSELLKEFEDLREKEEKKSASFYLKILTLIVIVAGFGIYVGDMLFGKSSLDVLVNLQSTKEAYEQSVYDLKQQNAVLQKEYFELKDLDPDIEGRQ